MPLTKVVPQASNKTYPRQHRSFILLQKTLLHIEDLINRLVSPRFNPFYYLGAISSIFFLILLISGIYLFIFYRTNNPYQIVKDLTEKQWYLGGIMRSLHRYSSDGLMVSLILHFIREFFYGRYVHNRWIAWVSGLFLFILTLIIGIIGYWLVWDERAQL
ncbi:MAG: cytochrome b N-terminal domain-containing protein, partial [Nitrospirota bacterium]